MTAASDGLKRVCVKLYASPRFASGPGPGVDDQTFVPIFHEWIRDRAFGDDLVLFDVADYAHVPDGPGIVLVSHEAHFSLDRSDGRFGLHVQRRVDGPDDAVATLARAIRHGKQIAERLAQDPRVAGKLEFDLSRVRVESNDRLRAPNTDAGWSAFEPVVRAAAGKALDGGKPVVSRVQNDPRDRLAADVKVA